MDASLRPIRVALAGIVLLVAGSLGPWADVAARDGWISLVLALVAGLALWRGVRAVAVLCATLVLAVVLYDLLAIGDAAGVEAGWGLWTTLVGGLVLALGVTVARR